MEEKIKPTALITIVIPTYNQKPEFLTACIESVLNQTYHAFELIISDNHSSNGISEIIKDYTARDKRIRLVMPDEHIDLIQNFAFAAHYVKTSYLSFLSSDDWVYPDWLESMMPEVIKNDVDWAYGEVEAVDISLTKINYLYRRMQLPTGVYTAKNSFKRFITLNECGWMVGDIIKTAVYAGLGGIVHEGVVYCADLALAFKLHERGSVYYLNKTVAKNRQWYFTDGKVDSRRSVKEISDFVSIYSIAEKSDILRSYLAGGQQTIDYWKKNYALKFSRILFVDYATKALSREERNLAAGHILELNDSIKIRVQLLMSKNQRICRWLYAIYSGMKK